jgi:hypothetical protein
LQFYKRMPQSPTERKPLRMKCGTLAEEKHSAAGAL